MSPLDLGHLAELHEAATQAADEQPDGWVDVVMAYRREVARVMPALLAAAKRAEELEKALREIADNQYLNEPDISRLAAHFGRVARAALGDEREIHPHGPVCAKCQQCLRCDQCRCALLSRDGSEGKE